MLLRTPRCPRSHTRAPTHPQDVPFFTVRAPVTPRGPQDGQLVLRVPVWGTGRKVMPRRVVTAAPRAPHCPLDEALPLGGCWQAGQGWSHPLWPTASSGPGRLPNRQETTPALGRTPGSSMPAVLASPSSDRIFISFPLLWGNFCISFPQP